LDVLGRVVRVDGGEVAGLGPARRAGGVPEVEDDDVAAPVREVELVAVVGRPDELDGLPALALVPRGPRAVTRLVAGPRGVGRGVRAGAAPAEGERGQGEGGERPAHRPHARASRPAASATAPSSTAARGIAAPEEPGSRSSAPATRSAAGSQ